MTYDLINNRDTHTGHQSSVSGSLTSIEQYLSLGLSPRQAVLGFVFYSKWFTTTPNCTQTLRPTTSTHARRLSECFGGCPLSPGISNNTALWGAVTFEPANMAPPPIPKNLTVSTDGTCGYPLGLSCPSGYCCSQYGSCGNTTEFCSQGCQNGYGNCPGPSITSLWVKAKKNAVHDESIGADFYLDRENNLWWTWDTPQWIAVKFEKIVQAKSLLGVMAWGLGMDTFDYSHMLAIQKGVASSVSATGGVGDGFGYS